jgi:ACS family glucarate transporter-like MFS transporter
MGMDVLTDPVPLSQVKLPATTRWGIRHKVVGLVMIMGMLTYLDRVSISKLAPNIMSDLSLSKVQMGYVFSAFALAYALFELPSAWLADRTGTRSMLTRIVIWWSAFTIATAGVFSYGSLLAVRFLFGMGEAGAWPGMAKTFSRWIPRRERGTIQGIFFAGAHLSGGLTPIIVTTLVLFMPWRWIFVVFGALGLVWALVWHHWFRDDPAQHGEVGASELALILSERETGGRHDAGWVYWKKLFRNPNTLGLCLIYFPNSFIFYFCITWLPTFLKEKYVVVQRFWRFIGWRGHGPVDASFRPADRTLRSGRRRLPDCRRGLGGNSPGPERVDGRLPACSGSVRHDVHPRGRVGHLHRRQR